MDEARARYVALERRRRRARNRFAAGSSGRYGPERPPTPTPVGDRKAADGGRQRSGIGATLADVWPGARP